MNRISLILLFATISSCTFSQSTSDLLEDYCKNFDYEVLIRNLDKYKSQSTDKIKYEWSISLAREIVDDNFEQIIKFVKKVQDEDNHAIHTIYIHKIKLLKKDGIISYYKVVKIKNVKKKDKWFPTEVVLAENANYKRLIDFKKAYKKTYILDLNFNELFETKIVYGNNCGITGREPVYRMKLNKIIKKKNTSTLIRWLKSATVELQLYAIYGVYTLQDNGIEFSESTLNLINVIELKEGKAYTCSGCSHWNQPIIEIVKRIKKEHNKS